MMANVLLARCALPTGPVWGVLGDDRIEIVATDAGTNGGFLASLLQLQRPVRALLERRRGALTLKAAERSEEHTSELQSPCNLVCRLLLEKKKKNKTH